MIVIAALLVAAGCPAARAADAALYDRPMNADCVAAQSLDSGPAGSLYPQQFLLDGDSTTKGANYTQARSSSFPAHTKFFTIPLTSVSVPETVPYAFLRVLNCTRPAPGTLSDLFNQTLLSTQVAPHVDGLLTSSPNNFTKAFAFSAATDPGSLNRAEWIKYLGLFFNKEKQASDIYAAIKADYDETAQAATRAAAGAPPVVAWVSRFSYGGEENYQISFAPYKANLTTKAGGAMLDQQASAARLCAVTSIPGVAFPDSFGAPQAVFGWNKTIYNTTFPSKSAAQAAFAKALSSADVIIDETFALDPAAYNLTSFLAAFNLSADQANGIPALAGAAPRVYREDGLVSANGSMDWFEGAVARPDAVLKDLFRVLYPTNASNFRWLRAITQAPVTLTPAACTSIPTCDVPPTPICPFVYACPAGAAPALLQSYGNGQCVYATCGGAVAPASVPGNAAFAAAPAVLLTIAVVVLVEALMQFC
eukprot:scaffold19.g1798.t1